MPMAMPMTTATGSGALLLRDGQQRVLLADVAAKPALHVRVVKDQPEASQSARGILRQLTRVKNRKQREGIRLMERYESEKIHSSRNAQENRSIQ
jgi:hypothetical protein